MSFESKKDDIGPSSEMNRVSDSTLMSRDEFIMQLISAIGEKPLEEPRQSKSSRQVFDAFCHDFPLYQDNDIASLRKSMHDSCSDWNRLFEEIGFYYNSLFLSNISSLTNDISLKSFVKSSESTNTEVSNSSNDDNSTKLSNACILDFCHIYATTMITIPKKLLAAEYKVWLKIFREDQDQNWFSVLLAYRRLIQNISASTLLLLGNSFLQSDILPSISAMIEYFSVFISYDISNASFSQNSLGQYIVKQLKIINSSKTASNMDEEYSECFEVVDSLKDITSSLLFLVRDVMTESPELITAVTLLGVVSSVLGSSTASNATPKGLSSIPLQELTPQQYLILTFLSGLSISTLGRIRNTSVSSATQSSRSIDMKAVIGLQVCILGQLPLVVSLTENLFLEAKSLDFSSNNNRIGQDYWGVAIALIQVLLTFDSWAAPSQIVTIHEKLIGKRIITILIELWLALTSTNATSISTQVRSVLSVRLAAVLISFCSQSKASCLYVLQRSEMRATLENVRSFTNAIVAKLQRHDTSTSISTSSIQSSMEKHPSNIKDLMSHSREIFDSPIDASVIGATSFWMILSLSLSDEGRQLCDNLRLPVILESSTSLCSLFTKHNNLVSTEYGNEESTEDNSVELGQESTEKERFKIDDVKRQWNEKILTLINLLDEENIRIFIAKHIFNPQASAYHNQTLQLVKSWCDAMLTAINTPNEDAIVSGIRRRLKSLRSVLDGQTTNKVD